MSVNVHLYIFQWNGSQMTILVFSELHHGYSCAKVVFEESEMLLNASVQ